MDDGLDDTTQTQLGAEGATAIDEDLFEDEDLEGDVLILDPDKL